MNFKSFILAFLLIFGLAIGAPFQANAETLDNDVDVLFVNQTKSFTTVVVQDINTGDKWELRLQESHPNKNSVMAILLTAVSLNEPVRIRWEEGDTPILLRAAINRL